jgi:hypothetical protein
LNFEVTFNQEEDSEIEYIGTGQEEVKGDYLKTQSKEF